MSITSLRLKQFRSYSDFSIELNRGVNIVVGPNASGKTNLLEAILLSSIGSSFRAKDPDMIKFGKKQSKVTLTTEDQNREVKLLTEGEKVKKHIFIDGVEIKRMTTNKILPTTLFEPEHLRMIHGSPDIRRDYLDNILELTDPTYKNTRRQYKRALAQRNRLLKLDKKVIKDQLFVWDVKLSEFGALMMEGRKDLVEKINKDATKTYQGLSGLEHKVKLEYKSAINASDLRSGILKGLSQKFEDDIMRGFTSIGPHRDDLIFKLNKHNAQTSASRGETRSLILMCKLIELKIVENKFGKKPTLLLDDVFSELDTKRRRSLTEYLKDYQVFITTTDADSVLEHFLDDTNVIPLGGS